MKDYPEKCECCGKPLDENCFYHIGTHKYVCSYKCHKHETELMISTYASLEKSDKLKE